MLGGEVLILIPIPFLSHSYLTLLSYIPYSYLVLIFSIILLSFFKCCQVYFLPDWWLRSWSIINWKCLILLKPSSDKCIPFNFMRSIVQKWNKSTNLFIKSGKNKESLWFKCHLNSMALFFSTPWCRFGRWIINGSFHASPDRFLENTLRELLFFLQQLRKYLKLDVLITQFVWLSMDLSICIKRNPVQMTVQPCGQPNFDKRSKLYF